MWAPPPTVPLSYPGKSQRPALPSACFSLQYKEGWKTKFFSRFGTRQDSVSISPPLPCYTSKMGCKPQLRIGRPHSGPQQHNWQAYLSLTELCRALGGGIMMLLVSHCSQGRCLQPWSQVGSPTSQVSSQMLSARYCAYMNHSSSAYRP